MTKAPFSLHCIICFEAFNLTDRPPVVLPCGHTYVCQQCSKRLKRCMECREPLSLNIKNKPSNPPASSMAVHRWSPATGSQQHLRQRASGDAAMSRFSTRYQRPSTPTTPPQPATEQSVPLPVPKNLVLMSLMEATKEGSLAAINVDDAKGYESGDDDEQVVEGMRLMSSGYGTYVVREKEGLLVHPVDIREQRGDSSVGEKQTSLLLPHQGSLLDHYHVPDESEQFGRSSPLEISYSVSSDDEENEEASELKKDIVAEFSDDLDEEKKAQDNDANVKEETSLELSRSSTENSKLDLKPRAGKLDEFSKVATRKEPPQLRLEYGEHVQIVSFSDGVAVLSRGRGHVLASTTQLVKVGDSTDQPSKIEGMLASLKLQRESLEEKLREMATVHSKLTSALQDALLEEELAPPPVMSSEVEDDDDDDHSTKTPVLNDENKTPTQSPMTPTISSSHESSHSSAAYATPDWAGSTPTPPDGSGSGSIEEYRERHVEFLETTMRGDIPMPTSMDAYMRDDYNQALATTAPEDISCPTPTTFAPLLFCGSFNDFSSRAETPNRSTPASPILSSAAAAHFSHHSPDRVNFRTGFSGHLALSRSHLHADRRRQETPTREVRMMSEHMGIATPKTRKMRRPRSPNLSNPTW